MIPHHMEGVIGFEPLVDSVDLPPPDDTVDVSRDERVDEWIEHDQIAVHAHVKTVDQPRLYRCPFVSDATN